MSKKKVQTRRMHKVNPASCGEQIKPNNGHLLLMRTSEPLDRAQRYSGKIFTVVKINVDSG